jgi:hypothetical protein
LPSALCLYTRERLQTQHVLGASGAGNYKHFVNAYQTILAKEGIRGLFRGCACPEPETTINPKLPRPYIILT